MNLKKLVLNSKDWRLVRANPLSTENWFKLLAVYANNDLIWQSVYVAKRLFGLNKSLAPKISDILGDVDWQSSSAGDALLGFGECDPWFEAQLKAFTDWLAFNPDDWLTWVYLARLRDYSQPEGSSSELINQAFERAKSLEYIDGESAHLLGLWRLRSGNFAAAVDVLSELVGLNTVRYGSMMYLGEALFSVGNVLAAEKAFARASLSNNPDFLISLAKTVYNLNYWQEAVLVLKKSLVIKANNLDALILLARIELQTSQLDEFESVLEKIVEIKPDHKEVPFLRLSLLGQLGDAEAYFHSAKNMYQRSGESNTRLISTVLMTSLYQDKMSAEEIAALHKSLFEKNVDLNMSSSGAHTTKNPKKLKKHAKKLRIGYVTGDLHRQHPVNLFLLPLLAQQHQSENLEVCIYHTGTFYDEYTHRASQCAAIWLDAIHLDDAQLCEHIRKDEVDVLIDLAGHTSTHRLGVFMKRPAPVQLSFLGYPHSTGLTCFDYYIGDAVVSPIEHEHLFSEKVARLDASVFCWAPVDDYPIPEQRADDLPIVFGSFNNPLKISNNTIALWAQILKVVPESKLLLKASPFVSSRVCKRYSDLFAQCGIEPTRILFRGPSELGLMMQAYGDVDIALDPLPYNGGTTSLQALWMGVPLITLCGNNFPSRMGASFLNTLGKNDWVAMDEASYVSIAKKMSESIKEIRSGRDALRASMKCTPLSDIKTYASSFEKLLFQIVDAV